MKTKKNEKLLSLFLALCMVLTMLPISIQAADGINYIDATGVVQTVNSVTELTSDMNTLNTGWYVVDGEVTMGNRITVKGDVHLILADGCKLNAENGGINVKEGNNLTIYAQSTGEQMGALMATGTKQDAAGIGGYAVEPCGTITINGGSVTATSGLYAAGIGGGAGESCGTITINGGNVLGRGIGNSNGAGAGIGAGNNCAKGTVIITGGTVTAICDSGGAGIGGGWNKYSGASNNAMNIVISGGNVTAIGDSYSAGIGNGRNGGDGTGTFSTGENGNAFIIASSISDQRGKSAWNGIIIEGDSGFVYGDVMLETDVELPSNKVLTVPEGKTLTIAENTTFTNLGVITNNGTFINFGTINGNVQANPIENYLKYIDANGDKQDCKNYTEFSAEYLSTNNNTLATGWYVIDGEFTISDRITVSGDVHLILKNGCKLDAQAGITVQDDDNNPNTLSPNSLSIYAQSTDENTMGTLIAVSNLYTASGIGGENGGCGNITINGGNVTSTGNYFGAAIGGGNNGAGGNIIINGGKVTSTGCYRGATIGGGQKGEGGNITINGGVIEAINPEYGAGIGGGMEGKGGNITINDGTIHVYNGRSMYSAGIGGGYHGDGGTIQITGGNITVEGSDGAAIGGGDSGNGGNIIISGGTITATNTRSGAGIGGGSVGNSGDITISGGTVNATNANSGAGIGGGKNGGNGGNITISGGIVNAEGYYGAGIGGGESSGSNNITISGGIVNATGEYSAGIGKGFRNYDEEFGTFSTGTDGKGTALIIASSISDQSYKSASTTSGIIFEDTNGVVYGDITLEQDFEIKNNNMLTILEGSTLTVPESKKLINNGTIHVDSTKVGALSGTITEIAPLYKLTIDNESPQYYEANKDVIPMVTPPVGQKATGFTSSDGKSYLLDTTFYMPAYALNLTTKYVNDPTFIVTIPSKVMLGETASVSASSVNVVSGSNLKVEIDGEFKLANVAVGSAYRQELSYSVKKDNDRGTAMESGDTVLTIAGGIANSEGSQTLYFSLPNESPKYSDPYTGMVTFTISIAEVMNP